MTENVLEGEDSKCQILCGGGFYNPDLNIQPKKPLIDETEQKQIIQYKGKHMKFILKC